MTDEATTTTNRVVSMGFRLRGSVHASGAGSAIHSPYQKVHGSFTRDFNVGISGSTAGGEHDPFTA